MMLRKDQVRCPHNPYILQSRHPKRGTVQVCLFGQPNIFASRIDLILDVKIRIQCVL